MEEIKLTKNAAYLLTAIHKSYKKRKKAGESKLNAVIFGSPSDIREEIRSKRSLEDIEDACWELYDAKLLDGIPAENSLEMLALSNTGIVYEENRSAGVLKRILGIIKELLPFIS